MYEHDSVISEYSHERFRPREAEALLMLRKVASLVKPIMRQRGWRVGVLTEFYPPEQNLLGLNWNKGQKICLRLRYPGDERQFLPIENVVDTMLHELAHIVHGPHDTAFHALWDQLRDEHESLVRKGYTGEGFLSAGRKLGGSGRVPISEARRLARKAAEQRRMLSAGSGQKLGGAPVRRGADIRKIIADAAQRRMNVTKGCAGVEDTKRRGEIMDEVSKNGFRTKAEEEDANERAIMDAYIELLQEDDREAFGNGYIPPSQQDPLGSQGRRKAAEEQAKLELETARGGRGAEEPPAIPAKTKPTSTKSAPRKTTPTPPKPVSPLPQSPPSAPPPSDDSWACQICTFLNPPLFLACAACETERLYDDVPDISSSQPAPHPPKTSRNKPSSSSGSSRSSSRPNATSSTGRLPSSTSIDRGIRKKRSRDTLAQLASLNSTVQARPLGWSCTGCGTFMEREYWVCAGCGRVKESS
jgi:DNA-dependent metalloprotease WSS1